MAAREPESIAALFNDLIQGMDSTINRSLKLTANSELQYTLSITDIDAKLNQVLPRFALPCTKQNSLEVSKFLKKMMEDEMKLSQEKTDQINKFTQGLDKVQNQYNEVSQQYQAMRNEYNSYRDDMEQKYSELYTKHQLTDQEKNSSQQKYQIENTTLKKQLAESQQEVGKLIDNQSQLTSELHKLQLELGSTVTGFSGNKQQLDQMTNMYTDTKQRMEQAQQENRGLLVEKANAEHELEEYRNQSEIKQTNMLSRINELQQQLQMQQAVNEQVQKQLYQQTEERNKFQAMCEQQNRQVMMMQADREELMKAFQNSISKAEELNLEVQSLQQQMAQKEANYVELNDKFATLQEEMTQKDNDNRELNAKNIILQKEATLYRQRAEAAESLNGQDFLQQVYRDTDTTESAKQFIETNRKQRQELIKPGPISSKGSSGSSTSGSKPLYQQKYDGTLVSGYQKYMQDSLLPPRRSTETSTTAPYMDIKGILQVKQQKAIQDNVQDRQRFSPNSTSSDTHALVNQYMSQYKHEEGDHVQLMKLMGKPIGSGISQSTHSVYSGGQVSIMSGVTQQPFGLSAASSSAIPASKAMMQVSKQQPPSVNQTNVPVTLDKYRQILQEELL